ncbi:hypothetical protein COCVIDRAFT_18682 [Bipolaris victoriae FI3]|uniref:Uncharacterized protein n=2 Tax=Bipolaris TaxID=33194 RepID=W6YIK4_COCC2|nr:uncharacterized protein COCCADRAFT_23076 [Bipolaris zeicola 26-R-13]XP_014553402.1 hypothetical protein COCVIDRAFT_18682 [Bipolaris victoriae FI3]EUC37365.1 hypothetical protein COCCADRAFT_23076 [Bipolaris zeicola 26-R-13]
MEWALLRAEHASAATVASIQPGISLGCGIAALACRFDDERNYDVPGASLRKQPVCAMEPHGNYELAGPGILLPRCSASTPCRRRVLREGEGAVCISHVILMVDKGCRAAHLQTRAGDERQDGLEIRWGGQSGAAGTWR